MQNSKLLETLKQHDNSSRWEYPPDFRYLPAIVQFQKFTSDIQKDTGLFFRAETGQKIQDAPFHSQLWLPTVNDTYSVLRFSSFGNMVAIADEESVAPQLLQNIIQLLHDYRYIYVPEEVHNRLYTGKQIGIDSITT